MANEMKIMVPRNADNPQEDDDVWIIDPEFLKEVKARSIQPVDIWQVEAVLLAAFRNVK